MAGNARALWVARVREASCFQNVLQGLFLILLVGLQASAQAAPDPTNNRPQSEEQREDASPQCCSGSAAEEAWNLLAEDIRSHSRSHRSNAIAALAIIGPRRDIVPLLEGALRDKDSDVRRDAANALGMMQARSARQSLRARLSDESPEVAFAAADALWKMGDRSGRKLLMNTLDGTAKSEGVVKHSITSNLNKYRDPKQLALTGAKEAAGTFVGPLPIGFEIARELLKDRTASARAASAELLGKDPSPAAVEKLSEARFDKNWAVRAATAQALAVSPGKVSVEALEVMLDDGNAAVRDIAAAGIIRRTQAQPPKTLRWPIEETSTTEAKR